jgi:hypothetical protein
MDTDHLRNLEVSFFLFCQGMVRLGQQCSLLSTIHSIIPPPRTIRWFGNYMRRRTDSRSNNWLREVGPPSQCQ